ncbi:unnamed protein product [Caenorhabditis bovis]|uniref:RRM domain-containing protein n=1 Tax=Caenorhabditis bovis TaxID=2654633 RepID=A0A8S1F346_9PELO|nr:unnamed protein product [Caenorhabditis bovis]
MYHHSRPGYHSNEPTAKRYRRDDDADPINPNPSKVVHVRNLNTKATEADLLEALSSFGPIAYATCIPHSRMALVEFEEIDGAKACVQYSQSNQINVGGQIALFNYSTSHEIERIGFESSKPNKVLVLTVLNAQYPITADVIHQICDPQARVLRIVVMHKPTVVQALVEFEDAEQAKKAKHAMNGADIYSGCCTLKVEFAKPEYVRVHRQDKDQRDYTIPNEMIGDGPSRKTLLAGNPGGYERFDETRYPPPPTEFGYSAFERRDHYAPPDHRFRDSYRDGYDRGPPPARYDDRRDPYYERREPHHRIGGAGGPGCVMLVYGLDPEKVNCDMLFNVLCLYGNVLRICFMRTKVGTGMIEMGMPEDRRNVLQFMRGFEMFGMHLEFKPSNQDAVHSLREPFQLPDGTPSFRDYSTSRNNRFTTPEFAAKNRIVYPTSTLHWFNAPGTMTDEKIREMVETKAKRAPIKIEVFPSRNERSAAGTAEFETIAIANEVLALVNHTPVDSPYGSAPFIVKWAYATPAKWDGYAGVPPRVANRRRSRSPPRRQIPEETTTNGDEGEARNQQAEDGYRGSFRERYNTSDPDNRVE